MSVDGDIVKTTCPRDCYDACGMVVVRRGGVIAKVLGDPDHAITKGKLCGKCAIAYNGAWRDSGLRLSAPLKRVGKKGAGEFEPVSWDAALGEIGARFGRLINEGAARSILHTHYTGTVGLIGGWYPIRFFNRIGATEVDPDTVCNKAGHAALDLVFGNSLEGFDPRTAKDARTILVWGANPSHSAPHQDTGWLADAKAGGAMVIAIDPIGHQTALAADLHLKLFPGSDAALTFAMMHVIHREGLMDEPFIASHVLGLNALAADIEAATPEWAENVTGVPAALIERTALVYAEGPSLLWLGQGVQRQPRGGNVFRALAALIAMTGNLGKPGSGFLYMNGPAGRGIKMDTLTAPLLAREPVPAISHMDLAATLEDPARARAFVNWNNNPAASSPQQGRLRRALQRENLFHVAIDLFHTQTTAYADLVLPAASFLEFDDLVLSYFDLTLSAQVKAGDPPGTALPNQEIFRRLAATMGLDDEALHESDGDLLNRLLAQTPFEGTFADLAERGTVTLFPETRIQFESLAFATPSGKIEIASDRAAAQGLPRLPQPHADARPAGGALRILSPAGLWQMNSSYGNDPVIRRRVGPPLVTLHPDDASARGLSKGDRVLLSNQHGRLAVTVRISEAAQPGAGIVYKGWWPDPEHGNANINALFSGAKSDIAESTTVHGIEVEILRLDAAE